MSKGKGLQEKGEGQTSHCTREGLQREEKVARGPCLTGSDGPADLGRTGLKKGGLEV